MSKLLELPPRVTKDTYLNIDNEYPTTEEMQDEDIVNMVQNPDEEESEDEEEPSECERTSKNLKITSADAFGAIEKLDTFFVYCEEVQEALKVIRNLCHNKAKTSLMQP